MVDCSRNSPSAELARRLECLSNSIVNRLCSQPGAGLSRLYGTTLAADLAIIAHEVRQLQDDRLSIPPPPLSRVLWDDLR